MSKPKELDVDPKAIEQIKFAEQLKNQKYAIVSNESMLFNDLGKIKERRLTFSQGSVTVL